MALLLAAPHIRAQKAYPIDLLGLLGQIPIPQTSNACYNGSTRVTDSSNGVVSIKNTDPTFGEINGLLDKITKAAMTGVNAQQIAAMQQGQGGGVPSSADVAVMKQVGAAQSAAGRINQLMLEFAQKLGAIDKSAIDKVSSGPNCPEVQQGGYAGPTCDCMKSKDKAYRQKRVNVQDTILTQVKAVIYDYLGKIKAQAAIVDNLEHAAKYGDAVSNPLYKQLVGSVQRQALGGVVAILGACESNWEDAAKIYANLVNANSGASVGCYGR